MYFNHLNYPAAWRAEYSKYPEGLTILESLMQWIRQVDDMVDSHNANQTTINGFGDRLDSFVAQYGEHLQATITETLSSWQASGFLDVVIDAALQTEMDNLATTTEQALFSFSEQLADIKYKRVNVRDYGAVGDGVRDDSAAFRSAIAALDKDGGILDIPYGVYLHGDGVATVANYPGYTNRSGGWSPNPASDVNFGPDIRFLFEGFKNITINGNNALIVSNAKNGETRNNSIFTFIECDNLKVYDLDVDGNIETRIPEFDDRDDGKGHLIRGNIYLQNCRDVYFKNVKSHHSMLDGIFAFKSTNGASYNHIYEDCVCNYNYRQGLTLSSIDNAKVIRGEYNYTGTIFGTMPKSGIDVEADASNAKNISITDTVFKGNASNNLVLSFRSTEIVVDGCQFYDGHVLLESPLNRGNIVKNCKFFNNALTVAQEEIKLIDNEFNWDIPIAGSIIEWTNVPDNGGSFSEFSGNKVKCDLPDTIDMNKQTYYGALRVDNSKVKIHDNEFIDVFATKYVANRYHAIRLIGNEVTDNKFSFTRSFDTTNTRFNIISPGNTYGNKITGYTEKEVVSVDLVTGYKLTKRFNLSVVSGTPIEIEVIGAMFFKLTTYDSANTHYEEKLFVFNSGVGSMLGSKVLLTINPSTIRAYETIASYDFTKSVLTCTITPSFTGTLYADFDSNAPTRIINSNSVVKR